MENFEEKLNRLEDLSSKIKKSDISLEDALKVFEEGTKLAKSMEKYLDEIEGKVQKIINNPNIEDKTSSQKEEKKDSGFNELDFETLPDEPTEINGTRA